MLEAIRGLVDTGIINEDTRKSIQEAWDAQLSEAKVEITNELREEYARKYEHDKATIVEALDTMTKDWLKSEISEFAADKKKLAEDRVALRRAMRDNVKKVNAFILENLAREIKELHGDRAKVGENFGKLEKFVIKTLSEEINEFSQDKRAVVETKVRLIKEANEKFGEIKKAFIKKSSALVAETVMKNLKTHMSQFKEDIEAARQNNFGRRLFEAFANEYQSSLYNEKGEVSRLIKVLAQKDKALAEAKAQINKAKQIVESKNVEIRKVQDRHERSKTLTELTANLDKSKKSVMMDLLEGVQTSQLKNAFQKYLPAVLNETVQNKKPMLAEGKREVREVTGNKVVKSTAEESGVVKLDELKKLAGIQ